MTSVTPALPVLLALLSLAACQSDSLPSEAGAEPVPQADVVPLPDSWVSRAPMPTGRANLAVASVGGTIYAIGGRLDNAVSAPTARVEAYRPNTTTLVAWRVRAPLPQPRGNTNGAAVIDGRIYVAGGGSAGNTGGCWTTEVYDPATDTWSEKADILTRRIGPGSAAVGGKFYVIGGRGLGPAG